MAIFRLYPKKSNTIASGSSYEKLNSSQGTVASLWYGGVGSRNSISRHLVYFDLSILQEKLNSKEINPEYVVSYILHYKNSTPEDLILEPEYSFVKLNKNIASSFDLIAFPINKEWDEGRGFDLNDQKYIIKAKGNYALSGYSNWLSASTLTSWDEPGVFSNPTASTNFYTQQHFEIGSENIDFDVTNIIQDWLSGGSQNYGFGISYSKSFEDIGGDIRYVSSFFTQKTNTAFKPYLEVKYNQVINDDRFKVSTDKKSRLFLYLFSGNTPVNYYSAGTVSITNISNQIIYSGLTPIHHSKGVYYVELLMSGATKGQNYKDVWSDITFNPGIDVQTINQTFNVKGSYYKSEIRDLNTYVVSTYGIENNEILQIGEVVRIYALTRMNFSLETPISDYCLEYRIIMNEMEEIVPWTPTNLAAIEGCVKSFFDLDTRMFLNNQNYEIAYRIVELGTRRVLPERLRFKTTDGKTSKM